MKAIILIFSLIVTTIGTMAQTYADSIAEFRKAYISELIADGRSPIKTEQAKNIHFFAVDKTYDIWASVALSVDSKPFMVMTHSGKQKPFREYGVLTFFLSNKHLKLHAYQSMDLLKDSAHKNALFVPFNDATNYKTTFGGGRYIDLSVSDIKDGYIRLDFNKCYNPYCAYADGYSCPIPPAENELKIPINGGEQVYKSKH